MHHVEPTVSSSAQAAPRSAAEWEALVGKLADEVTQLRRQIAWFQRQIFGQKSERRVLDPEGVQGSLGESFDAIPNALPENKKTRVEAHERQHKPKAPGDGADESTLFFDDKKVPVEIAWRNARAATWCSNMCAR